jgi:hypothetical protein
VQVSGGHRCPCLRLPPSDAPLQSGEPEAGGGGAAAAAGRRLGCGPHVRARVVAGRQRARGRGRHLHRLAHEVALEGLARQRKGLGGVVAGLEVGHVEPQRALPLDRRLRRRRGGACSVQLRRPRHGSPPCWPQALPAAPAPKPPHPPAPSSAHLVRGLGAPGRVPVVLDGVLRAPHQLLGDLGPVAADDAVPLGQLHLLVRRPVALLDVGPAGKAGRARGGGTWLAGHKVVHTARPPPGAPGRAGSGRRPRSAPEVVEPALPALLARAAGDLGGYDGPLPVRAELLDQLLQQAVLLHGPAVDGARAAAGGGGVLQGGRGGGGGGGGGQAPWHQRAQPQALGRSPAADHIAAGSPAPGPPAHLGWGVGLVERAALVVVRVVRAALLVLLLDPGMVAGLLRGR